MHTWIGLLLLQMLGPGIDVCGAGAAKSPAEVVVRGTGTVWPKEGLVIFDYFCGGAARSEALPESILIGRPTTPDHEIAEELAGLRDGDVFQMVVSGRLECRRPFLLRRSDDGDITNGNGFGALGLSRCRINSPIVRSIKTLTHR